MNEIEFKKALKLFHRSSDRHILVAETDMSRCDVKKIVLLSDKLRRAGNRLVAIMLKNYNQLMRTKRYRKLLKLYGNTKDKTKRKELTKQLNGMQEQYNVTWDFCRKSMIPIAYKYKLNSVFALTKAEDIWRGIEKCLYDNGKTIHFYKYGDLSSIRAKQVERGIPISIKNGRLSFKIGNISFGIQVNDRFQKDTVSAVLSYLDNSEEINKKAVDVFLDKNICVDTFRPCYATIVPKKIRGKYRIYLHLTIEGKALPKFNKNGELRHNYGTGNIGTDIGTQTVAYTSKKEVGLKNLAERGQGIFESERQERLIYRAMDRSRKATNGENYNDDGTIRSGRKKWKKSNNYQKLQYKHQELCRKNAINRKLAINQEVNHLRSLADVFITEPKNASKLMKRTKETTKNEKGKFNKKKRFGKSIKNRCPGYFQATAKKKFEDTGGKYIEVPNDYRASQYDHTTDDYIKKKLSDRMFNLQDGTKVQRDWYSSFLLYCYDVDIGEIDKNKCNKEFKGLYEKETKMIDWIKESKIVVLNSGIKVA